MKYRKGFLKSMDLTRELSEEEIHEVIDLRMKEEIRKNAA